MQINLKQLALSAAIGTLLAACSGDDGDDGANGTDGAPGTAGLNSLVNQSVLTAGNAQCFNGGVRIDSGIDDDADGALSTAEIDETSYLCNANDTANERNFNRVSSFLVCSQIDANCDDDTETSAEIAAVSEDGMTLLYSDSPREVLGFVDITDPAAPVAAGVYNDLGGEPTSVAVKEGFALVAVNTSADFVNVSGHLEVVNIETQAMAAEIDLGGQPDSIAISPDGNYAAVVLENERNEDICVGGTADGLEIDGDDDEDTCEDGGGEVGGIPQNPAGELVIVDTSDAVPTNWTTSTVSLTGLADVAPTDPEPEYVDINENNVAVVTLQENNHIVLVDLENGTVTAHFSAGEVDLDMIDTEEDDPFYIISQTDSENDIPREPDGVAWINNEYFATADEGDYEGGSRGFTIFNTSGDVVWTAGNTLDHWAARIGHHNDDRSGNKGNEPENVEVGVFDGNRYLFVNSERSSLVFVYNVNNPASPELLQILPAALAPEGGVAIPSRNLLAVASEADDRGDKFRSVVNLYRFSTAPAQYPTLVSEDRVDGTPIPFAALSGLSSDPSDPSKLYSTEDSFYGSNRIFTIDVSSYPAKLVDEITILDSNNVFAGVQTSGAAEDADSFDDVDLANMINADGSVNIDPEGIAKASDGGYWVASEGRGTASSTASRPIESRNFIFKTNADGVIESVVTLPDAVNDIQVRFGFEGIAEYDGKAYVAIQRAWGDETNPRIGIYDVTAGTWEFVFYPLDAAASQNGGWVGLSDISSIGNGEFLVLERDNQGGPDAAIKRMYRIDLSSITDGETISKTLVADILGELQAAGGLTPEKVEGSAVMANGDVYVVNDNDGVDDNSGEIQLINLGNILP